jgi:tRNA nucleotidyltransferase (CCA-adding enzyme)
MNDVIAICRYRTNPDGLSGLRPSQIVSRLDGFSPAVIYCLQILSTRKDQKEILHQYAAIWRKQNPTINGHDLERMGVPPGAIYRDILNQLRTAWLDGIIHSPEEERDYLNQIFCKNQLN